MRSSEDRLRSTDLPFLHLHNKLTREKRARRVMILQTNTLSFLKQKIISFVCKTAAEIRGKNIFEDEKLKATKIKD